MLWSGNGMTVPPKALRWCILTARAVRRRHLSAVLVSGRRSVRAAMARSPRPKAANPNGKRWALQLLVVWLMTGLRRSESKDGAGRLRR